MRMQDYTTQQGLAESSLNRGQANNQFNAGMSANDLSRNLAGGFQGNAQNNNYLMQGAMFDSGNALNTQQFNSSLGNNDLTRNSNLAQAQGQFNTGALNTNSMFNAGNMNTNTMFNAGQGNNMNQFNASAGNSVYDFTQNTSPILTIWDGNGLDTTDLSGWPADNGSLHAKRLPRHPELQAGSPQTACQLCTLTHKITL